MAQKITQDDLTSLTQDWGGDAQSVSRETGGTITNPYSATSDNKPFSGLQVQKFIKGQLTGLDSGKVGHVTLASGNLNFYDKEGGTALVQIPLSGTLYDITLTTSTASSFDMLLSEASHTITITPSTKSGSIGSQMVDFPEDYTWFVEVDNGSGYITKQSGTCLNDASFSFDVRPWVIVGTNKIRVNVTGATSGSTKKQMFTANVTSMTFSCSHDWSKAWKQGSSFSLGNIYFSGSIAKQLHVVIDSDSEQTYTQDFTSAQSYITTPFTYDLSQKFPTGASASGVHTIETWLSSGSIQTPHVTFNIMCVTTAEQSTAKLCCINEVTDPVVNYTNQTAFKYACYGTGSVNVGITAADGGTTYTVLATEARSVTAETQNDVTLTFEIGSSAQSGVSTTMTASVTGGNTVTKTATVDNSKAFPAVDGADFYMNTTLRNNGQSNKTTIVNNAVGAATASYAGTFGSFSWLNDGWATDDADIKCLSIPAGCTLSVPTMLPLAQLADSDSLTLEWKMKVANVADYDTPVMSFMDTAAVGSSTNGIIVYPTKITILGTNERVTDSQSVNMMEESVLHIVVVFQSNYKSLGHNLCKIFINGVMQRVFEYTGTFGSNAYFRAGQDSSDLYIYMMRWYDNQVLEDSGVLQNYLNTMTDSTGTVREAIKEANEIFSGDGVSYDLVKALGYNTMVIETAGNVNIPDLDHTSEVTSTLKMEFADHPTWNWSIANAPVSGQGTTSMKYYRWNLRAKNGSSSVWTYADGTTTMKSGWFDGANNHPKVTKITAKKNVASSQQGHKMGACAMYDDLFKQMSIATLPSGARVSVYQYPVMGFQHNTESGAYTFIGLYTIGPDKGDDATFGYDATTYPDYMSIEGPNHAPMGTRFLVPWVNAEYVAADETLKFGGQEAWDLDSYNESGHPSASSILSLYESEWKPAYELVYYCSPWIKSLSEVLTATGYASLAAINADVTNFRNGTEVFTTRKNEVITMYDASYNIIYYDIDTEQYVTMADSSKNIVTYLGSYLGGVTTPTTAQILAARKAKFAAEMEDYFHKDSTLYHYCFCLLIGASDNFAKNSYPFKLSTLTNGGLWMWRQDDLDTILATDNNGYTSKQYYAEPGDLTSGEDIFQGSSSALWTLVGECFADDIKTMMGNMVTALKALASSLSITAQYDWSTVLAMFSYYFWENSAKYFPIRGYNADELWSYIDVWQKDTTKLYNGVRPLAQANGTQFEAEMQWATLRIIYMFSKYSIGGFTGTGADGLGSLDFTSTQAFTFSIKPAIWMYPAGSLGSDVTRCARTSPSQTASLTTSPSGDTNYYVKGLDYLNELGDLSTLILSSRGGSSEKPFSVTSKRLKKLKVGDATAANVTFNATSLAVSGQSVEEIDAQNVTTVSGSFNLSSCPRLRKLKLAGSTITTAVIPAGARVNEVSLPDGATALYLNNLPVLTTSGLTLSSAAKANLTQFYSANCQSLDTWTILKGILATTGNHLTHITAYLGTVTGVASDIDTLYAIATGSYGRVTYDSTAKTYATSSAAPDIQGSMTIARAPSSKESMVTVINAYFSNFTLTVTRYGTDLSKVDVNGNTLAAQETANCYVIKEAGNYMLPLVYGCGIKGGAINSAAYTQQGASTGSTQPFYNYENNQITSPYIETDTGVQAASAVIVWNDSSEFTISNFSFETGTVAGQSCRYLAFDVDSVPALGGNAIIAIKDASNVIMWSWHLWAYPETITNKAHNNGSMTYNFMDVNIGWVKHAAGSKYGTHLYYQWGRKDPMIRAAAYDNYTDVPLVAGGWATSSIAQSVAQSIQNPNTFFMRITGTTNSWWRQGTTLVMYCNYYDYARTSLSQANRGTKKTIYDPSPVGYAVPTVLAFANMTAESSSWDSGHTVSDRYFPAVSARNPVSGILVVSELGRFWSTDMASLSKADCPSLIMSEMPTHIKNSNNATSTSYGLPIAPVTNYE